MLGFSEVWCGALWCSVAYLGISIVWYGVDDCCAVLRGVAGCSAVWSDVVWCSAWVGVAECCRVWHSSSSSRNKGGKRETLDERRGRKGDIH